MGPRGSAGTRVVREGSLKRHRRIDLLINITSSGYKLLKAGNKIQIKIEFINFR
jgi:hypothetical protein